MYSPRAILPLTGETAERFVREAEWTEKHPTRERRFSHEDIRRMQEEGMEIRRKIDSGEIKIGSKKL